MKRLLAVGGFVSLLSGCASIISGTNQPLSVQTRLTTGEEIIGANCKLENPKGTWFVTTPGTVTVHRAYDDLSINCTKAGEQPGIAAVKSSTKGMAFGNILFGGIIGGGIDAATGAAYDYPPLITIQMGHNITINAPVPNQATAQASSQPTSTQAASAQASSSSSQITLAPGDIEKNSPSSPPPQ